MTLTAANVLVGTANATGIYIADAGTAGPASVTEDWGVEWTGLGYLSEDGISLSKEVETEQIKAWQSKAPIRTVLTGKSVTLDFTMIELTPATAAIFFGESAPTGTDDEFTLTVLSDSAAPEYAVGIDTIDGDVVVRYIFGRASVSANGEISLQAAQAQGLPVTMEALTDDNGALATIIKGSVGS